MMAAHTRMPGHAATAEKAAFVEDLIRRLGLSKAADSVVGDKKKRGSLSSTHPRAQALN